MSYLSSYIRLTWLSTGACPVFVAVTEREFRVRTLRQIVAKYRLDTKAKGSTGFRSPSEAYIKPKREARGFYEASRGLLNPVDPYRFWCLTDLDYSLYAVLARNCCNGIVRFSIGTLGGSEVQSSFVKR